MKTSFLTLIAALLMLAACSKKEKDTTITGQVRTFGTEEAIKHPPVEVVIYEEVQYEGGFSFFGVSTGYITVASSVTDKDGNFVLAAKLNTTKTYYLGVVPETVIGYYYYRPDFSDVDNPIAKINTIGGTFNKNYYLTAQGWIRFQFNISKLEQGDFFYCNLGYGPSERFESNIQIEKIRTLAGGAKRKISYTASINGELKKWEEQLYIKALDTIDHVVNF